MTLYLALAAIWPSDQIVRCRMLLPIAITVGAEKGDTHGTFSNKMQLYYHIGLHHLSYKRSNTLQLATAWDFMQTVVKKRWMTTFVLLQWWPALYRRTLTEASCQAANRGTMTIRKRLNMAAMETMCLKEAMRLFVSKMGNGLRSHLAKVGLKPMLQLFYITMLVVGAFLVWSCKDERIVALFGILAL